jgi:CO dehydrogenase/acetyl-CoA synthase gamma subunit (corrinoid Fe-S protein)
MPDANLYLGRIDLAAYLSADECRQCGADSCKHLVDLLRTRSRWPEALRGLPDDKVAALKMALGAEPVLPAVPSLQVPRPSTVGLVTLNDPRPGDPVLITGNSELTQEVLLAVLSTTVSPFYVLFTNTRGDTLDMAVLLESFTPDVVGKFLEEEKVAARAFSSTLYIPGLAAALFDDIAKVAGMPVQLGPVCAAELPLFFGKRWARP